ncbi:hypothetical protein PINS_up013097 [Pythium insidiosum]|nr:hypothetical protein PINS_up013097 [Pythium insidiosum]
MLIKQLLDVIESRHPVRPVFRSLVPEPSKKLKDAADAYINIDLVSFTNGESSQVLRIRHKENTRNVQAAERESYRDCFSDDTDVAVVEAEQYPRDIRDNAISISLWEGVIEDDTSKQAGARLYTKYVEWRLRRAH